MTLQSLRTVLTSGGMLTQLAPDRGQLRDMAYLVVGNVLKFALGLAPGVLIFRALGPTDVGRLALVLNVISLFSIVGEFGLRDAAVNYIARFIAAAPERARQVARTFLVSKVSLAALAGTFAFFSAGLIAARFYPQARVADLIRLGAVSLLTDGLLSFSMVMLEAQQSFAAMSALGVIQSLVRAGLIAAFFLIRHLSLTSLVIFEFVVPLATFAYSLRLIPRSFVSLRRPLLKHLGLLFQFTKWIAIAALASTLFMKFDVLMLSGLRASAEVGVYAAALALIAKLEAIKNAVLTTAFPQVCRCTEHGEMRTYVSRSLRLTGATSLAILPLFVMGGMLIVWLYGAEYGAAAPAFYPLLAAFLIGLNVEPVAFVLYPLNRPQWVAVNEVAQLAVGLVMGLALIPAFGIVGAAWGVLIARIASALVTFGLVQRFLGRQIA
jgi:O-antigen/teichoic acid export membrane protein